MIIQWTNKHSGEQGFVKCLNKKDGYFENTFNENEAKKYSERSINKTIGLLNVFCPDNIYQAVDYAPPKTENKSCEENTVSISSIKDFEAYKTKYINKGVIHNEKE